MLKRFENLGIAVDVTVSPGLGHKILLEPTAMEGLKDVAGAIDSVGEDVAIAAPPALDPVVSTRILWPMSVLLRT